MKRRKSSHFFFLQTWIWCFFWMRRRVKMNTSIWEGAVIKQHNSKVKFHLTQKAVPIIGWWKKKCQESDFKGMLFENSPWAGTVIKLSMITLFFISELIFREITWWWTKPEWWPGRRNSLVSEIKVASSGDLESFVGTRCFFSVAWPNPPEHSLEAGGGWWRLVAGHLTTPASFVGTLQVWGWGTPGRCHYFTEDRVPESRETGPGTPGRSLPTDHCPIPPLPAASWGQPSQQHSTREDDPACVFFLESTLVFLGTQTKFTAMMSKGTHQ